ncbi:hypothetical protein [Salinarimonas ramus]|uniref:Uncharacterized protein n=1 Tax=Salinarimonas ramus TaxID=690164 RepID=A0A917QLE9_9HYPH|nr:hypothetical protein [Salinarimonas ramus]GGK54829.1 hypothetical protein GCM10011322_47000 [Salinarimonas ramus]
MRLLSALLALLIALSVVAAPLPGALGVAHAGTAHPAHVGVATVEPGCEAVDAPGHSHARTHSGHAGHGASEHPVTDQTVAFCSASPDNSGDLAQAGCCEMAMCHPFLFVRGVDAQRTPQVAIAAAWRIDTLVEDHRSNRIERPPRA